MKSSELTAAITALANAVSLGLSESEITLAASIFVQLADTLSTIAAVRAVGDGRANNNE